MQSEQYGEPLSLLQSTGTCTGYCVFGIESSTFSWASDSDKAACLRSLYVIFMDLTSRKSWGPESVQLGDVRLPPLLFFNDVVCEISTNVISDVHWSGLRDEEQPLQAQVWGYSTLCNIGRISVVAQLWSLHNLHLIIDPGYDYIQYLGQKVNCTNFGPAVKSFKPVWHYIQLNFILFCFPQH